MIDPEKISILIVDDVKSMRTIAQKMLRTLNIGKVLHTAKNGVEGLKVLYSTKIDLVILDWKMPVMNGSEMLETIKNDRYLRDIPVIMVTGESQKDIVLEAAEIEVEAYLIKPLTPAVLEKKIKIIFDNINHPDMASIHIKKAKNFEELEDLNSAIQHMQQAAILKPGASRVLRNLGLLYQKTGDEDLSQKWFLKAVKANPGDAVTKHLLAEMYWKKKNYSKAGQYYLEVLALTRKFSDRALLLGKILLQNELHGLAKELFAKIIATSVRAFSVKENIADICMQYGERAYAKDLFKELMKEHPSNYEFVYKAGLVYEKLKKHDKALEHFLIVEKNQTARIDVKLKLAQIYFDKKKTIQADRYVNDVLRKEPENKDALTLRQLL